MPYVRDGGHLILQLYQIKTFLLFMIFFYYDLHFTCTIHKKLKKCRYETYNKDWSVLILSYEIARLRCAVKILLYLVKI